MVFIYALTLDDFVMYIGASVDPRRRLRAKRNQYRLMFQLKILEETDHDGWITRERHWIAVLQPKLNRHAGGTGGCNWQPEITDEFRAKKKNDALAAWQDPGKRAHLLERNKARWADPEQKERHRLKHLGAKRSLKTRARISAAMSGKIRKPLTVEHRAKISAANKGKKRTPEQRARCSIAQQKAARKRKLLAMENAI